MITLMIETYIATLSTLSSAVLASLTESTAPKTLSNSAVAFSPLLHVPVPNIMYNDKVSHY